MPPKEAVVRARVDERLKRESEDILRQPGLSQTEAIRMFFTQIVRRRGLPFQVVLPPEDNDKPKNPVSCGRPFQILLRARQARQITEPLMAALASLKMPREVIVTVDPVNPG